MKKVGSFRLAFAFGGCFLGAGYVSGQEMWQFFGQYGISGIWGLLLAIGLLSLIGAITLLLTRLIGRTETDRLIIRRDLPFLRWIVFGLEAAFLFCVCIIMTAGVGALCDTLFGVPLWLGCAVFSLIITLISFTGFSGMVTAFTATVPVLIVVTLFFGLRSLILGEVDLAASEFVPANPLMRFWPVAAILFMCYNVFGSVAILAPLGPMIRDGKCIIRGILLGALLLLAVAFSILFSVSGSGFQNDELPMLSLALSISKPLGWVYGILLLLAMFGTCLSCLVAFLRTLTDNFHFIARHRVPAHVLSALLFFSGSLFGFGDLIGVVYPVFGYCSSIFIVLLVIHYFRAKKQSSLS